MVYIHVNSALLVPDGPIKGMLSSATEFTVSNKFQIDRDKRGYCVTNEKYETCVFYDAKQQQ
jgi:hypothetical protein